MKHLALLAAFLALPVAADAAVHRVIVDEGQTQSRGSAVSFARKDGVTYLLTCWHVVDSGGKIYVDGPNGKRYGATLINRHQTHDAALIAAKLPATVGITPLAESEPQVGSKVTLYGFPMGGGRHRKSTAHVLTSRVSGTIEVGDVTISGQSGGGIFDRELKVVGLIARTDGRRSSAGPGLTPLRELASRLNQREGVIAKKSAEKRCYVFSAESCGMCKDLWRDVAAGKLKGYSFVKLEYGTAEFNAKRIEFERATGRKVTHLPTFWVPGRKTYRVAYRGPRGLLGWLASFFKNFLIGRPDSNDEPTQIVPAPSTEPLPPSTTKLREDVNKLLADLKALREGNAIQKIKAVASLRSDVDAVKGDVAKLAELVKAIVADIKAIRSAPPLEKAKAIADLAAKIEAVKTGNAQADTKIAALADKLKSALEVASKAKTDVAALKSADGPIAKAQAAARLVQDVREARGHDAPPLGMPGWLWNLLIAGGGTAGGLGAFALAVRSKIRASIGKGQAA